ncbi:alpha/beta hydrolase [Pseudactinotalea sp. HY158]|uniref:alpha/beta hydrolase n=1 Tax=Pseudactinotalea sp. HY158 TaxID=2654547 RepID=UPI00129CA31A|nr:alpha/beta hydrolase [Pseudactinotalea sp. HY158]QGH68322.1 alpha/beta fold hydrolase [Pseudactinotalea sp. HY158]
MAAVQEARPDVLGEDWARRTIRLAPDGADEPPVATLVHRAEHRAGDRAGRPRASCAVLYVHGFVDYFFQVHHARTWERAGYDFFALDLRDYGRSIRPGRRPNWITDLGAYDEELDAALGWIRSAGYAHVLLAGHSTGGLVASLYAHDHPRGVDGLVLNSPWLDLNEPWPVRHVASPLICAIAPVAPLLPLRPLGRAYGESLHISTGGEWDYNLNWKPLEGFGVAAGWFRAIRRGHARIRRGLSIDVPVLVATSGARGSNTDPTPADLDGTDTVLSPPQMWRRARGLGRDVTVVRIAGGRHDLTLSRPRARNRFDRQLTGWLAGRFAIAHGRPPFVPE